MGSFGLFPEGFVPARTADIRAELEEGIRGEFGRSLPLGDDTLLGFLVGIISERLGLAWEVLQQIYGAMDPNKAVDDLLRVVCSLTGTFEIPASSSTVHVWLCGDDGTVVAAGAVGSTASTQKRFDTFADATIVALDLWSAGAAYVEDDRVTNAGRCYICIEGGIAAGAGGPTTTDDDIVDNFAHWRYLGEGGAAVRVTATSEDTGPIVATAGDLTVIETPAAGWNTIRNIEDAKPGRGKMTNQDLRLLREAELAQPGTGTPDAIRAALLGIDGVTNVTVFFNNTAVVNADGMPPNSCEALVQGGDDQTIFNVLWSNVPIGIATVGTTGGTALDAEGVIQAVRFSRPTEVPIYVIVDLIKDAKTYGGDALVKQAIAAWGAAQRTGKDAVASAIGAQSFAAGGVLDVTSTKIGTAPAPGASVTIAISDRELATYDTGRVTVNATNGTP